MWYNTVTLGLQDIIDGDAFEQLAYKHADKIQYLKTDTIVQAYTEGSTPWNPHKILITHNSDYPITEELLKYVLDHNPPIHWFAQNCLVASPLVTSIPIGLERTRWFPDLHKRELLLEGISKINTKPSKLCLANFSLSTNKPARSMCAEKAAGFATKQFVGNMAGNSYELFISSILEHQFVLCPEGNGADTHRLWETLYLGRIPVVTSGPHLSSLKGLPILALNNWSELSAETLTKFADKVNTTPSAYTPSKLFFGYWENTIVSAP